ncbi:MAG TPA: PilW family protein [Pseudomonadales bacterium]|nr:PilW family protein [Pseudomonadales bacterium]
MKRTYGNAARSQAPGRQQGLSLIELMVAMTLGAFITFGVIQVFSGNQETYRLNVGQARLQENMRFALDTLADSIRAAGFTGCFSENDKAFVKVNQVGGETPYEVNFAAGAIAAHDGDALVVGADPTWTPALTPLVGKIPTDAVKAESDVLTVRFADPVGSRLREVMANTAAPIKVRPIAAPANAQYVALNYMVVSDCEKATIFQAHTFASEANGPTVTHNGGGIVPGNALNDITASGQLYGTDATLHAIQTQVYFVAPGAGVNNRGANPSSLWRRTGTGAPVELVEGIEDLQVLFGVDTDGDGVPNRYRTFDTVTDTNDIVTMRIAVTASSVDVVNDDAAAPDGGLLLQTFTNTIAIRNRI